MEDEQQQSLTGIEPSNSCHDLVDKPVRSYVHVNTSIPMSNNNYMLYSINTNIYLMVLWEHGIMNHMILN
jgi:hypothetical protein